MSGLDYPDINVRVGMKRVVVDYSPEWSLVELYNDGKRRTVLVDKLYQALANFDREAAEKLKRGFVPTKITIIVENSSGNREIIMINHEGVYVGVEMDGHRVGKVVLWP